VSHIIRGVVDKVSSSLVQPGSSEDILEFTSIRCYLADVTRVNAVPAGSFEILSISNEALYVRRLRATSSWHEQCVSRFLYTTRADCRSF